MVYRCLFFRSAKYEFLSEIKMGIWCETSIENGNETIIMDFVCGLNVLQNHGFLGRIEIWDFAIDLPPSNDLFYFVK